MRTPRGAIGPSIFSTLVGPEGSRTRSTNPSASGWCEQITLGHPADGVAAGRHVLVAGWRARCSHSATWATSGACLRRPSPACWSRLSHGATIGSTAPDPCAAVVPSAPVRRGRARTLLVLCGLGCSSWRLRRTASDRRADSPLRLVRAVRTGIPRAHCVAHPKRASGIR